LSPFHVFRTAKRLLYSGLFLFLPKFFFLLRAHQVSNGGFTSFEVLRPTLLQKFPTSLLHRFCGFWLWSPLPTPIKQEYLARLLFFLMGAQAAKSDYSLILPAYLAKIALRQAPPSHFRFSFPAETEETWHWRFFPSLFFPDPVFPPGPESFSVAFL